MAQVRLKDLSAIATKNLKTNDSTRPNARNCQMSRATPEMREFARRLIKFEAKGNKSRQTQLPITFLVVEKLRTHLSNIMGNAGFRALLSRSLALAKTEVPWLRTVQVNADGTLDGSDKLEAQVSPDDFFDGSVVLLAHLLGLLVAFIGESLTLRMMGEVWPHSSLTDLEFSRKGIYEKKN